MIFNIQRRVMREVWKWIRAGKFQMPAPDDNMLFIAEEVGEAIRAYQKTKSGFVRNNPEEMSADEVAEELADVVIMCAIMFDNLEKNLHAEVEKKLEKMNKKRGFDER